MAVAANPLSALHQRRIDVCDEDEVRFWTRELGVGRDELYNAIRVVGTAAHFVRAYLSSAGSVHLEGSVDSVRARPRQSLGS